MIAARRVTRFAVSPSVRSLSTVQQKTIRLTFVDTEGNRAIVPGLIGQTLAQAAIRARVDLLHACDQAAERDIQRTPIWEETTFGEGPRCYLCHVQIPSVFNSVLPTQADFEKEGLKKVWEEDYTYTSRLACQITLTKDHEGMVVYVPDVPPVDML